MGRKGRRQLQCPGRNTGLESGEDNATETWRGFKSCFVGKMPGYSNRYYMSACDCRREVARHRKILVPGSLGVEVSFTKMKKTGEIAGLGEKIRSLGLNIRYKISLWCLVGY